MGWGGVGWGGVNSDPRRVHNDWGTPTQPSPHIVQYIRTIKARGSQEKPGEGRGMPKDAKGGRGGQGRPGKARESQRAASCSKQGSGQAAEKYYKSDQINIVLTLF